MDSEFVSGGGLPWERCASTASEEPSEGVRAPLVPEFRGERKTAFAGDKDEGPRPACGGNQDDSADHAIGARNAVMGENGLSEG